MSTERPQFYQNKLKPVDITPDSLRRVLQELRTAARHGADLVQHGSPPTDDWGSKGMFSDAPGLALMFLRLDQQAQALADQNSPPPDFRRVVNERVLPHGPDLPLLPARLSPLGSSCPLSAVVLRVLSAATSGSEDAVSGDDVRCLSDAVRMALAIPPVVSHGGRNMGVDEVMFGRAGLLWALLNMRTHRFNGKTANALSPVLEAVPRLIGVIIDAGRKGSTSYSRQHGTKGALPLMWTWMEGYSGLGAVHGMTAILAVLLACRPEELKGNTHDYRPWIADTITGLCQICIASNGHLPTTIPPRSNRPTPLVQICHGSPGILVLLASAKHNSDFFSNYWRPEWDQATRLATERVWEEGLLSKGGSICHGIAGNAWPLLLLHDCFEYSGEKAETAKRNFTQRSQTPASPEAQLTGDYFLSRALAFLLHARETRPYNTTNKTSARYYRMPDSPYCLFEGLAGTVCAWTDACAAIEARLRKMELDEGGNGSAAALEQDGIFQELIHRQLGFPALGGHGVTGVF